MNWRLCIAGVFLFVASLSYGADSASVIKVKDNKALIEIENIVVNEGDLLDAVDNEGNVIAEVEVKVIKNKKALVAIVKGELEPGMNLTHPQAEESLASEEEFDEEPSYEIKNTTDFAQSYFSESIMFAYNNNQQNYKSLNLQSLQGTLKTTSNVATNNVGDLELKTVGFDLSSNWDLKGNWGGSIGLSSSQTAVAKYSEIGFNMGGSYAFRYNEDRPTSSAIVISLGFGTVGIVQNAISLTQTTSDFGLSWLVADWASLSVLSTTYNYDKAVSDITDSIKFINSRKNRSTIGSLQKFSLSLNMEFLIYKSWVFGVSYDQSAVLIDQTITNTTSGKLGYNFQSGFSVLVGDAVSTTGTEQTSTYTAGLGYSF